MKIKEKIKAFNEKHTWVKPFLIGVGLSTLGFVCYKIYSKQNNARNYGTSDFAKSLVDSNVSTMQEDFKQRWCANNNRNNVEKLIDFANSMQLEPTECMAIGYFVDPTSDDDKFMKYICHYNDGMYVQFPFEEYSDPSKIRNLSRNIRQPQVLFYVPNHFIDPSENT